MTEFHVGQRGRILATGEACLILADESARWRRFTVEVGEYRDSEETPRPFRTGSYAADELEPLT